MKIDLQQLGLAEGATLSEVQAALDKLSIFSQAEVTESNNAAANGARSASEAKFRTKLASAKKLSEGDAKILQEAKSEITFKELRKDKTLAKFNEKDFKLIVKAEGIANLEGDARAEAIKGIATEYADKMSNGLPKVVDLDATKETKVLDKPYVPGSLNLMVDNEK